MQLCYRGNTYAPSTIRLTTGEPLATAKFMGNSYTVYGSKPNLPAELSLYQYRGITYTKPTVGKK